MRKMALFMVGMLLISAIPLAGGDSLFRFVGGTGTDASQFGFNVTYLGDINGDGYDDVAVGAPYNDSADGSRADCGAVYIFFGYPGMDIYHGKNIDVASANVTIYGANAGDHFGWSIADAGDVNGDGYNDTIVGAPDALTGTTERNGSAYVFYGKSTWSSTWDLSTTGADVTLKGKVEGGRFGLSVSGAGDVNGDLYDDVIIGAPGKTYFFDNMDYPDATIAATTTSPYHGWTHGGAGDDWEHGMPTNGDNVADDDAYGPTGAVSGNFCWGTNLGGAYLNDADCTLNSTTIDLTNATDPKISFFIWTDTEEGYDYYNVSIHDATNDAWITDVIPNSDTDGEWRRVMADIAPAAGHKIYIQFRLISDATNTYAGIFVDDVMVFEGRSEAFVFYGNSWTSTTLYGDWGSEFGYSVSSAGDINNDGYDDLVVGAPALDDARGGSYLFYGSSTGAGTKIEYRHDFDDDTAQGWALGGTSSLSTTSHSGGYSVLMTYSTSGLGYMYKTYDLRNMSSGYLTLWTETVGLDAGEYLRVDILDGVWHHVLATQVTAWTKFSIDLTQFNRTTVTIFIYPDGADTGEGAYVDDVNITLNVSVPLVGEDAGRGDVKGDRFGYDTAYLSDINGDSLSDFAVSAPNYTSSEGKVYTYFGSRSFGLSAAEISSGSLYYVDSAHNKSQSFIPKRDCVVWGVALWVLDYGTDSTGVYVSINASDAAGLPGTSVSSTEYVDFPYYTRYKANDYSLPDLFMIVQPTIIKFSTPASLTANTKYWITLWGNTDSSGNGYLWAFGSDDPDGDNNTNTSSNTGSGWAYDNTNEDLMFRIYFSPDVSLTGENSGDKFGYSVSGGSDIGGDGIPDIIVGAPYNDGKAADGGAVYVFNGSATMPSSISASDADYINYSANAGAHFGLSVSKAGDVNGDGFNDVIAGSPAYSSNSGRADILSCHKPPRIVSYDLQDSSGASKLNAQIDVNSEYHFIVNVTHPNGWDKVDYVRIHAWYDFGSEATQYNGTLGGNINMFLEYENTTGTAVFRLRWPTGGEVTLGTCSDIAINSTTHSLEFYFTPGAQFRYAPGDGAWNSGPGLNDINSWNFEINVTDTGGWYDSVEDEFGVYRFTSVSADGSPQATGYPGLSYAMSPNTTLTYSSNADFRLNVTIDDLWNSAHTASIGAANVAINWTGHGASNYVYFTGAGSPIWIFGSASSFEPAPLNGTSQTITVYWRIDIPAGTLADTYSSPVNYTISQT